MSTSPHAPLKQCRDCKMWLPATPDHFNKTALYISPDGLSKQCKTCRKNYRKNYQKRPEIAVAEGYKRCVRCEQILPATTEYFHADIKKKDGLDYTCKQCTNQSRRKKIRKPVDPTSMKQCTKCKEFFPATLQYFHSHKKYADGLYYQCKPCRQATREEHRMHPPTPVALGYKRCNICEAILPATPEFFYKSKNNRRSLLRSECISCIANLSRTKRELALPFQYGGMKTCSQCKQSKPAIPEYFHVNKVAKDGLEYCCKACYSIYYQHYSQGHPDVVKARRDRRRAHLRGNGGTYTPEQIQTLLKRQKYQCYYCHKKFEKRKINGGVKYTYHIDHTFPLSRVKGIPANSIDYLVLACPTCNWRKGNKFPWEFWEGGRLL